MGLVVGNPLQAAKQIIGINDDKPARALGQRIKKLLVSGNVGELGNDLPGLIVLIGSVHLAGADPAGSAATSSYATGSAAVTTARPTTGSAAVTATGSASPGAATVAASAAPATAVLLSLIHI